MTDTITEFNDRVVEVNKYCKFLYDLEADPVLYYPTKKTHRTKEVDGEMLKIMKASFFLILYNLCESTVFNSLDTINRAISREGATYSNVIEVIKQKWIKENKKTYFENISNQKIVDKINNIALDIIQLTFDGKELSGNTSASTIIKLSQAYGFSSQTHHTTRNGREITTVKDKRNHLAHGNISFTDCGKDYTVAELDRIRRQVISHLNGIIKNIDKYIGDKGFLIS